ncbi:hypothetical protein D9M72_457910 [compost metagenome]
MPVITSSGRTGVASRFSMVPRSRSRVMARPVIITMVIVRITPIRPGMMLYWVRPSGLYRRCTCTSNGALPPASGASEPFRSWVPTLNGSCGSAAIAWPVAEGSVASASTSSAGRSPRSSLRVKSGGMLSTNCTSPFISASRPAASSGSVATTLK